MTAVFAPDSFYLASESEFKTIARDPAYRIAADCSYAIHLTWTLKDYLYVGHYRDPAQWDNVAYWCLENAGLQEFLLNRPAQAVLFKNQELATMCKLTWSE